MGRLPGLTVLHRIFHLSTRSCHLHRKEGGHACNLQLNQLYQDGHPCPVTWKEVNFANEAFSHPVQSKCTSKLNLKNKHCDFV